MYKKIGMVAFLLVAFNLAGCAGLSKMKEVQFQNTPEQNKATVNFVRRAIFMGDGAKSEVWDSEKAIGTLAAGNVLQYQAEPGPHTFMVSMQGNWAVAQGDLKAGKTYYLKLNLTGWGPIILGAAESTDSRIEEWNSMTTVTKDERNSKPVPPKYIERAKQTLERVENGDANVTQIADVHAK